MGRSSVEAGKQSEPLIYGQLTNNGSTALATFPLASFPQVPGYYAVQLRYVSSYDGTKRSIYFHLSVSAQSAVLSPHNSLSIAREPAFVPQGSTYGGPITLINCALAEGVVKITYYSANEGESYFVGSTGPGCFVRAQRVILE